VRKKLAMNMRDGCAKVNEAFLAALGDSVLSHGATSSKPLEVDLAPPLPHRIRAYLYRVTGPPGGRTPGEHKIQLILPGQDRGVRASLDYAGGRIVILGGLQVDLGVFVLWDSAKYVDFSYSRNVQVRLETILAALGGGIATQTRSIRGQGRETVIACVPDMLPQALQMRLDLTADGLGQSS